MNVSGIWWAADYLYGRKPLPKKKQKNKESEFKEVFENECNKQRTVDGLDKDCGKVQK